MGLLAAFDEDDLQDALAHGEDGEIDGDREGLVPVFVVRHAAPPFFMVRSTIKDAGTGGKASGPAGFPSPETADGRLPLGEPAVGHRTGRAGPKVR
ncbi:hypothetical protein ScoT_53990 [Streptomyces albidoflavus]|uniref:Uncharacterized protein n=1 Tax=Streptomyces albidoflavus TaxID=1886 RepID=A0AA37C2B4_9ACTN|nr:hypothetical protein ScoT_53990 [Streptomyces albidoflavus]